MAIDYDRELNSQQRAAVFHQRGPALVIAGAGTGKTRTLVYRLARLVERGEDPRRVLLLTFTRRAAREMLSRAARLLEDDRARSVVGGTFHSFANIVLRRFGTHIGIRPQFTILDRSDSEDVLQHLRTELGLSGKKALRERRFPQKRTLAELISKSENMRLPLETVIRRDYPHFLNDTAKIIDIRDRYRSYKETHDLLDYDDLLLRLLELLEEKREVQKHLAHRFEHILVDEYQDTNRLQAEILKALAVHREIMAVGDDAQSIYSFRGADFRNIIAFPDDFPGTTIYTIEENYRSTQPILDAANAVIAHASHRYEKTLFTSRRGGEKPILVSCLDEETQASYIADEILRLREEGVPLDAIAVLFRASAHSFALEAELARRSIPFVKYGGFKFAEAAHVKDAMAHLRWLVNPKDLVAAQRCLLLLEGVGPAHARAIADAVATAPSLAQGFAKATIPPRAHEGFRKLEEAIRAAEEETSPSGKLEAILPYLQKTIEDRFDDYPKRLRDLEHLLGIARRYRSTERFVTNFSIEPPAEDTITAVTNPPHDEEPLVLSTIHSAKGLEWHTVFIISVLDGYLPQDYAFRSDEELEEERRLLYVAMTRAKERLILTYPSLVSIGSTSMIRAEAVFGKPSHFLEGIPEEILPHAIEGGEPLDDLTYEDDLA
jgi:DNA helicase-2/ATP-dependent DNA helicase PcrA